MRKLKLGTPKIHLAVSCCKYDSRQQWFFYISMRNSSQNQYFAPCFLRPPMAARDNIASYIDFKSVLASISAHFGNLLALFYMFFCDRFLNKLLIAFVMDFGAKMAPKSARCGTHFGTPNCYFSAMGSFDDFCAISASILSPFWVNVNSFLLYFRHFGHPFGTLLLHFCVRSIPFSTSNL